MAALAAGGHGEDSSGLFFDEISEDEIDRRAAPESTPVILDADSSQRASIAAALGGRSFVMDGPPGTGKSQTIANMIGVLLHAGKTVLFVSEKAAALDVVRDRLDDAGWALTCLNCTRRTPPASRLRSRSGMHSIPCRSPRRRCRGWIWTQHASAVSS